jgi:type IX secretion system PorP/SprF family membrane protein
MRTIVVTSFLLFAVLLEAQQTMAFTQFAFNKAGMNPAASGTMMDQKYFFCAGLRRQWSTFDNSPKQNFVNFSYTRRPMRSYRYWQNYSFYADNDEAGLLGNSGVYLGYSMHWLLRKKHLLSFGLYGGLRIFQRNTGGFDMSDPAVMNSPNTILLYPDFIPGVRFTDHRTFVGASIRQVTINKQRDRKGRSIGTSSTLQPTVYLDWGRKIPITDRLLAMPAAAVYLPVVGLPVIEANLMYFYATRIGMGLGLRNASFASAILQIRFLENFSAGFSYSYPLNATRFTGGHTFEFMVGIVPYGMESPMNAGHSVARCPNLSY